MAAAEDSSPTRGSQSDARLTLTPEQLWLLQRQVRHGRELWQGRGRAEPARFLRALEARVELVRAQSPAGLPLSGAPRLLDDQRVQELDPTELQVLARWTERQRTVQPQAEAVRAFWRVVSLRLHALLRRARVQKDASPGQTGQ